MTDEARFPFSVVPFSSSTFTLKGPVKFGACEKEVAESICAVANDAYALGLEAGKKFGRAEVEAVAAVLEEVKALKAAGDKMANSVHRLTKKWEEMSAATISEGVRLDLLKDLSDWQKARN